jgi:hypothetical protein
MKFIFMQSEMKYKRHSYAKGEVYGRLTLTGKNFLKSMYGQMRRMVEAECECGAMGWHLFGSLVKGDTRSCGCFRRDLSRERWTTHGLTQHPLYDVHKAMIDRCTNSRNDSYKRYGGRGIGVCEEWMESFEVFYEWSIERGYRRGTSLDRIDNDGNYGPENCWYTTRGPQSRNTSRNINITAFGETKCLFDWAKDPRCKVTCWGLRNRIARGKWKGREEEAITSPPTERLLVQRNRVNTIQLTAFGETKCMTEWLEDARCVVKIDSLRDRLKKGMDTETALTKKPHSVPSNRKPVIIAARK